MAFSVSTVVAAQYDNTNKVAFDFYSSTGTYTLIPGRLYIALVVGRGGAFAPGYGATQTDATISWPVLKQYTAVGAGTWVSLFWHYRDVSLSTLTSQSQLVAFGDAATGCAMAVIEVTGGSLATGDGNYPPQLQTAQNQAASGSPVSTLAATFSSTPQPGNLIVAGGCVQVNEANTPEYANSVQANGSLPNTTVMLEWAVTQDTTPSFSWTTASEQACIVASEIGKGLFPRSTII